MDDFSDRLVDIFVTAIIVAVVTLKLSGVIKVSWLWLLSPIWILFLLGFVLALIVVICGIFYTFIDKRRK